MYLEVFLDGWKENEKCAKGVGRGGKVSGLHFVGPMAVALVTPSQLNGAQANILGTIPDCGTLT